MIDIFIDDYLWQYTWWCKWVRNSWLRCPQQFLKEFDGTIITDGYYGYNHIEGITNAYCWAHARRKFYDALPVDIKNASGTLANTAIKKIAKLFVIEKKIETLSPDEKVKVRQERSKPLVDDFYITIWIQFFSFCCFY